MILTQKQLQKIVKEMKAIAAENDLLSSASPKLVKNLDRLYALQGMVLKSIRAKGGVLKAVG